MRKTLEEYNHGGFFGEDFMQIVVEKDCECPVPRYRVKSAELQLWQTKENLVAWIRAVADEIEGMA